MNVAKDFPVHSRQRVDFMDQMLNLNTDEMQMYTDLENEVMPTVLTDQTETAYYDQYVET